MAYGVKYRLDFSDTEGNKRRLEILKKDYEGDVLPIIGTGSPVSLKWEQDNDFYDPLIASNCEINLIQTDFVAYEDFYDFDEREFLIQLYYADVRGKYWQDYEENWENANQFWGDETEVWNVIEETWENYNVGWDKGPAENIWFPFWQGYLIQDTYQQKISATPFNVSFKAVDGIGLLKGVDFPLAPNNEVTFWNVLHSVLFETGLDYFIYVKTDLKEEAAAAITNVFEDIKINTSTYTDENTFKFNCREVLYSILTGFNCRIFQAKNDFYIVNNGDIGTLENITYRKYEKDGNYVGEEIVGSVINMPSEALPLGGDLMKETSGGIIEVKNTVDVKRQLNYIPNGNFEDDFNGWTIVNSEDVSISENAIKGKSARITGTYDGAFDTLLYNEWPSRSATDEFDEIKFDFSFQVQIENGSFPSVIAKYNIPYKLEHTFREYVAGVATGNTQTFYYRSWGDDIGWTETPTISFFTYNGRGEWLDYRKEVNFYFEGVLTNYLPDTFKLSFSWPSQQTFGPHIATYIGGAVINWQTHLYLSDVTGNPEKFIFKENDLEVISKQITDKNLTNTLEYDKIYQGSTFNEFLKGYILPFGEQNRGLIAKFKRSSDTNYRFIEDITSQQRINDNRVKMERYEGSFKRLNDNLPVSLYDRVLINFATFKETRPAVIDTLKYNLKNNSYEFTAHLADQVTDSNTDFKSNQVSYPIEVETVCRTYRAQNNDLLNNSTIGYYDCEGVWTEIVITPDSQTNDFCATSAPERISGSTNVIITLVAETCIVGSEFYLLKKCSDDSTGWRTAQYTTEISLDNDRRVFGPDSQTYIVVGTGTTGTTVGIVTDAELYGCELIPTLTEFLRSDGDFPNPCETTPDLLAYHNGAGAYPVVGDNVFTQPNGITPLGGGLYLMPNSFYFTIYASNPGYVAALTECTSPILYYRLSNCTDGTEGISGQNTNEIDLENGDRVVDSNGVFYTVFGVALSGTSVGNITDTGDTGCPSVEPDYYYNLVKCSDGSTGWRSAQTIDGFYLPSNTRVTDPSNEIYVVSGLVTAGTSVGNITNTGNIGCPVAPELTYYLLSKCSDSTSGWLSGQNTTEITLNVNDRVTSEGEVFVVVGTAETGYSIGNVTDTGETGCPVIPDPEFYTLTKCEDSSTGYITGQNTTQVSLSNGDRVRDINFADYTVTGTSTTGNSLGVVIITGLTGCPTPAPAGTFVSTWDTRNIESGSSGYYQVSLGLLPGGDYDFSVDWGDGVIENVTSYSGRLHTYSVAGIYEIRITGTLEGWRTQGDSKKILSIKQWGNLRLTRAGYSVSNFGLYFSGCTNLDLSQVSDVLDLTNTTSLYSMFNSCTFATINRISEWNISGITSLYATFVNCANFNSDVNDWDTSSVTNIQETFAICSSFNHSLENWDVSNVNDAGSFMRNTSLTPTNLDAIYNSWGVQNLNNGVSISFNPTQYTSAGASGRAAMAAHWTINDGGIV